MIQPVLVHPVRNEQTGATRFMLVHGERRTRASIIAGKDTIPAFIKEMPADRIEALALLENLHRVDISGIRTGDGLSQNDLRRRKRDRYCGR
ncbi:MAG: ParB N-terminal domain-containing protein [Alistipes indistinctus]